jgi:hypothetical protein
MGSRGGDIFHDATDRRRQRRKANLAISEEPAALDFPFFFHAAVLAYWHRWCFAFVGYA